MTAASVSVASGLALDALAFARGAMREDAAPVRLSLPGVRLSVSTRSPTYRRALRTALIDNPAYAEGTGLSIVVADPGNFPQAPRWRAGPGEHVADIVRQASAGRVLAAYQADFDQWQFLDPEARLGVQLMAHSDSYPHWEDSFPLLQFLHWTSMAQGRRILHAATLGRGGKGVLIAGDSGAGKSGTTLAGLLHGLHSIGDDYVLVAPEGRRLMAYPLTRIMKQDAGGLRRNRIGPDDRRFSGPNWQGKHEAYLAELMGGEIPGSFELCAIVLPRIAQQTRLAPGRGTEAMRALLPSNLMQLGGGRKYAISFIADVVRRLPVYWLELGPEPGTIASTVAELVARDGR